MSERNRCRRQPPSPPYRPDQVRADIERLTRVGQKMWREQVTSDAPDWGVVLGLHVRLTEWEQLAEAVPELLP